MFLYNSERMDGTILSSEAELYGHLRLTFVVTELMAIFDNKQMIHWLEWDWGLKEEYFWDISKSF